MENFGIYCILSSKNLNSLFRQTFGTYANWNMLNLTLLLTFSVLDWKYPFLSNFGPKNWNCWKKSMVPRLIGICLTWCSCSLFCLRPELPFWTNLVQKFEIGCLRWNVVPRLTRICGICWNCFCFVPEISFLEKLTPNYQSSYKSLLTLRYLMMSSFCLSKGIKIPEDASELKVCAFWIDLIGLRKLTGS